MQTRNKMMDDISQLMTNAMGVAQGAREEAENAMKSLMDRWFADRDFVTREEFDAVRDGTKAREENEALSARLEALEKKKISAAQMRDGCGAALQAQAALLMHSPKFLWTGLENCNLWVRHQNIIVYRWRK